MSLSQIWHFLNDDIHVYVFLWLGLGYLIGMLRTKAKLSWSGRLSVVFSDGYELMTTICYEERQKYDVKIDARLMRIVLKNAVGRIVPPFTIYNEFGTRLAFTTEVMSGGNVEILFSNKIAAAPNTPTTLFIQFTSRSDVYQYIEIRLSAPDKK